MTVHLHSLGHFIISLSSLLDTQYDCTFTFLPSVTSSYHCPAYWTHSMTVHLHSLGTFTFPRSSYPCPAYWTHSMTVHLHSLGTHSLGHLIIPLSSLLDTQYDCTYIYIPSGSSSYPCPAYWTHSMTNRT